MGDEGLGEWLALGNASWAALAAIELEGGCGPMSMTWGREGWRGRRDERAKRE